jgi:hypothetical protein
MIDKIEEEQIPDKGQTCYFGNGWSLPS